MKRYAVILAAGKGSRMKSQDENISKISFPILGVPLVRYVIESLLPLNFEHLIAVIGHGGKTSESIVKDYCEVVWQREQKGAGHAVMMTAPILKDLKGETLITCGDTPLMTDETMRGLIETHEANHNDLTIMTMVLDNPYGYGRIVKDDQGNVLRICEQKDTTDLEKDIKEVNAGVYVFDNEELFESLGHLTTNNAAGEYYLTDVIGLFVKKGLKVGTHVVSDIQETLGVNDRSQLAEAAHILKRRINRKHMLNGVSIEDPENTYIAPNVTIGPDTIIKPGTHIYGETTIGIGNVLGPDTYLENVSVGNHNIIAYSHLVDTVVHNRTTLGPFLRTRGHVEIMDEAHIGNFNELKATKFGTKAKCAHLSYLGDAEIGEAVNVGCGTITANYDGINKHHTSIGENSFIGCGTTLVAPVTIEKDSFIAAGSTITENLEKGDFAIARARQVTKKNYARKILDKAAKK